MQTAIQLYTLRNYDGSILEILDAVGETTFDGVEFAYRVDEAPAADVRDRLDENGLVASSAHVGIDAIEDDFEGVVETAETLGYDDVVVPWLDPEHFETVEAVEETADRLNGLAEKLADEGLRLHYHNHDQEFVETDEGVAYHVLADRTDDDLFLEVDAGWALAGGADPGELIRRYGDRITHVHFKDVAPDEDGEPAIGEGELDVAAAAEAARDVDAEWAVFENDEPDDPATSLQRGADVLDEHA
ncbi:sugar phosphate isomerase/epimerase family protein [Halomicrobium urmianum]|uniref:sugar phosphate isomerase/epimerase family protein n=1 Tax=Halomicrobium urmianum TaxID=1586233 RepID=UPI001CDA0201|nr:sugar phosphate isomerase/epimerase [Halomicrobium urmianum]